MPDPGSFYRLTLQMLKDAHPEKDDEWRRQKARQIVADAIAAGAHATIPNDEDEQR